MHTSFRQWRRIGAALLLAGAAGTSYADESGEREGLGLGVGVAYSPLGSGAVLKNDTIAKIAEKHGKSPAQAIIRWHLQQGLIVIPKTVHADRAKANMDVFDFELDEEDMAQIEKLDKPYGKTGSDPATNNSLW